MVSVTGKVFLDVLKIFSLDVVGYNVWFGGFFHAPEVAVDVVGGEEVLFVVGSADGVDGGHVFAGESGLVDSFEGVLNFFEFWDVHLLASWLAYLLEALLKQLPHLYVPLICCDKLLIFALTCKPLNAIDGFRDLFAL